MSNLNPAQLEAVNTIDGPLLINAGAGSGKTHTITERVVHMIHDLGVDPRSIFCVTFTNKAAREMRERIGKRLGIEVGQVNPFRNLALPTIGTFHSVASFFLRMFIDRIGYGRDFVIYDSDDVMRLIKGIMKSQNIDEKEINPRAVQSMISGAKGTGLSPDDYSKTVDSYVTSVVLEVYRAYTHRLRQENALDFDDLLLRWKEILEVPEVVEYFHNRYRYYMVDEYQDTNNLQYEIIRTLASNTRNLCVVGDDWQGIYSWRGANIENILSFEKDYSEAKVINLEENYRSTSHIINAANAVIKNNTNQMKKSLFTNKGDGEKIMLLDGMDDRHEADLIASEIKNACTDADIKSPYADACILYRTNGQSRLLEEALIKKNIPYRVFGGMKFYERKEIKDILAYIRIIFNPLDSISLRRIINVPSRKIGDKSLDNLLELMNREHMNIAQIAEEPMILESLSGVGAKGIQGFALTYGALREVSRSESIAVLMDSIIKRIGYETYLKSEYTEEEAEGKIENLKEFMNMASRYDGMIYPENLASFLEDIALITDQDRENTELEGDTDGYVSLMTIHLAKGLEFPTVFIAGAEEGIFPHSRTLMDAKAIEEERRLMYVAITRAKKKLYITRAHERYTFGNVSANPKSRFVKEIPDEYIEEQIRQGSAKSIFSSVVGGFQGFGAIKTDIGNSVNVPQRQNVVKNSLSDFALGNRVEHAQYGVGTIIGLSGNIADIAFSGKGIKKMNVELAPIKKI